MGFRRKQGWHGPACQGGRSNPEFSDRKSSEEEAWISPDMLSATFFDSTRRCSRSFGDEVSLAAPTTRLLTTLSTSCRPKLGLTLSGNSALGFDAVDLDGRRYQIKGRRLTPQNASTELSAIRDLPDHLFDFLIAVVYRRDFTVDYAAQVPYDVVMELAKYSKHTNAYRFLTRRTVLNDSRVEDVTSRLVA